MVYANVVEDNRWLNSNNSLIFDDFKVDTSKTTYSIQYFNTKNAVSKVNSSWSLIKDNLDILKSDILATKDAIDAEDYKKQTDDLIKAIDNSIDALDSNFQSLFSSVVRRMNAAAETDSWFSDVASLYSSYILTAILGGKIYGENVNPVASGKTQSTSENMSASSVQYSSAPQSTNMDSGTESATTNLDSKVTTAEGTYSQDTPSVQTMVEASQEVITDGTIGEGRVINIPKNLKQTGLCPNYTGYDKFYGRWNKGTMQRELSEQWGAAGKPSSNGIATLNGRYLVAVSPKFGKVGDNIDVVLNDGQVIKATIADSKGNDAPSEWGHILGNYGVDIIEWEASGPKSEINLGTWANVGVDRIVNLTS